MLQHSNNLIVVGISQSGQMIKISGPHSNKTAEAAKRKVMQSVKNNNHHTQIPNKVTEVRVMSVGEFKQKSEEVKPTVRH